MDFHSAAQWLEEDGASDMAKKLRIPDGMRPDRRQQQIRGLRGRQIQLAEKASPPTLPAVKGPTLAEIEEKYGRL
jgi:hypothetical protein